MSAFRLKIKTDNTGTSNSDQFTLPGNGSSGAYNFDIDWGDGTAVETINTGVSWTHTFPSAGTYIIAITENVVGGFARIQFSNGGDKLKVLELVQWGTNKWLSFYYAFYGCENMTITATDHLIANTGSVTRFNRGWYRCLSLTSFPLIDTSSGTGFIYCWGACELLTSFPLIDTSSATSLQLAWAACKALTSFPLIDTSSVTNFQSTWQNCIALSTMPLIDTGSGQLFISAWENCKAFITFPLLDFSSATNLSAAWSYCTAMTSFPLIDTSSCQSMVRTWSRCTVLATMPLIDTSNVTDFEGTWSSCNALTSFPAIDTSSGVKFRNTWGFCVGLTSFPAGLDFSNGTDFYQTWYYCREIVGEFPTVDLSKGTDLTRTFYLCSKLTSFASLIVNSTDPVNFYFTWAHCKALTSFPEIDTSKGTNFGYTWYNCAAITAFPQLSFENMSNGLLCFFLVTFDTGSYNAILANSFLLNTNNNVTFHGGYSKYHDTGKVQRDILTAAPRNWIITDGGYDATYVPPVTAIRSPLQSHVLGGYAGPLRGALR